MTRASAGPPGFVVVDLETMDTQYIDNGQSQVMAQGAGIQAAELVARAGVSCLLTGYVGPKAFQALSAAGIKVGQNLEGLTVRQAVERFKGGQVEMAQAANRGRTMIVAVASGKGGTGKTTVAASLATVWDGPVLAVDLDVEEPNLHLFLQPAIDGSETAHMTVPVVDEAKCTYCGACSELCQFKAISVINQLILTFPEMCHGCGGCIAVCPEKAISPRQAGTGRNQLGASRRRGLSRWQAAHRRGHEPASDAPGEGQAESNAGRNRRRCHHRRPAGGELPGGQRGDGQRCDSPGYRAHSLRLL